MENLENKLFKVAYLNSPVAKIIVDSHGRIKNTNKKVEDLFKYDKTELINTPVEILLRPEIRSKHIGYVKKFFEKPKSRLMGEGRNLFGVDKFGKEIPIEIGLTPITYENEIYAMASIFDISTRLKIELRFQKAVEAAPIAMLMINQSGKIVISNKEVENLFGYSEAELANRPIEILVPNESKSKHPTLVKNYLKDPRPRQMGEGNRLFGLKKDGKKIPIEVGLSPVVLDDEIFVMSTILDISSRLEQENKFKNAVEAAPNAMVMINEHGKITLANKQCEELFQYTSEELLGSEIEILVPEKVRQVHPSYVSHYIKNPAPRAMGSGRDLFGQKKDGTLFPVEVGLHPIISDNSVSVISSIVDVSERVRDKNKILERNQELQQFSYRVSHDLKAPLSTISGLTSFILEDLKSMNGFYNEEVFKNADKIVSITERLKSYVSNVLDLSKADDESVEFEIFSFKDTLQEIKEKLMTITHEGKVEIIEEYGHKVEFFTQRIRLAQLIENLISNGIKYANLDRESSYIKIRTFNDKSYMYINIEDNGLGIPNEFHEKVFEMFQRFHKKSHEGSGLGLYLVKKHIDKLGGEISFESNTNGTVFFIKIPIIKNGGES